MKTVQLTRRIKVNPRKHVMFGETPDGYLFVIRHLVPKWERMAGFKVLYKRGNVKVCDNTFHVSEETFKAMMTLFLFKDCLVVPPAFDIIIELPKK